MTLRDIQKLKDLDKGDILSMLGLEERSPTGSFFTGLGLLAVGVVVGAGLGMLFAPRRGDELRSKVGQAWKSRGRAPQDFARDLGMESGTSPMSGGSGAPQ
jgi:hypothetical protein